MINNAPNILGHGSFPSLLKFGIAGFWEAEYGVLTLAYKRKGVCRDKIASFTLSYPNKNLKNATLNYLIPLSTVSASPSAGRNGRVRSHVITSFHLHGRYFY